MLPLVEKLMSKVYGVSVAASIANGVCVSCKQEAGPRCTTEAGVREFKISGLCEVCFNKMAEEAEDGEGPHSITLPNGVTHKRER